MNTGARDEGVLGRLAEAMGVLLRWRDLEGVEHSAGPGTQRALLAAMGVPAATESEARESLAELEKRGGPRGASPKRSSPGRAPRAEFLSEAPPIGAWSSKEAAPAKGALNGKSRSSCRWGSTA